MSDDDRFAGLEDFIDIEGIKASMKKGEEELRKKRRVDELAEESRIVFDNFKTFLAELSNENLEDDYNALVEEHNALIEAYNLLVRENRRLQDIIDEYRR